MCVNVSLRRHPVEREITVGGSDRIESRFTDAAFRMNVGYGEAVA